MSKVCLDELTVGQVRELVRLVGSAPGPAPEHPYTLGLNYLIRTVTHYYTGRLVAVTAQELVLADAAWVADTGRFAQALESGDLNEVEVYPSGEVILGRGAIVDACRWGTALPRKTK